MHVRQPHVATTETIRQPRVIDAQQVQHGGVQVVNRHRVFDGVVAVFVGRTVDDAAFDAAAGEPDGEAEGIVVAAIAPCAMGVRPNSPAQMTSVESSSRAISRSLQQGARSVGRWHVHCSRALP